MTDTMRERIARAAYDKAYPFMRWETSGELKQRFFLDQADAVLAAKREPTKGMEPAGDIPGWDDSVTLGLAKEVWQAMIDAAISEGKE